MGRAAGRRGALTLVIGDGGNFSLKFLRAIVLARMLSVSDFGIVGTLIAAWNLVQMTSAFNFQLLLVQHKRGNDRDFAAAIKGLGVARASILGVAMIALSEPLARLMGQANLPSSSRL